MFEDLYTHLACGYREVSLHIHTSYNQDAKNEKGSRRMLAERAQQNDGKIYGRRVFGR